MANKHLAFVFDVLPWLDCGVESERDIRENLEGKSVNKY